MEYFSRNHSRRHFLLGLGTASTALLLGGSAFAEERARWIESGEFLDDLVATPSLTEGPFFPDKLPLDTDNDLLHINAGLTPAVGAITHLFGRIVNLKGEPLNNATIEIWQVDNNGSYLHSGSDNREKYDKNFQGFGRFLTGTTGEYRFRTIKPVPYPGRTPHIHVKVSQGGKELLTTQCFIKGHAMNERDSVLIGAGGETARKLLVVPFEPLTGSKTNDLHAKFDIYVGVTPEDDHDH